VGRFFTLKQSTNKNKVLISIPLIVDRIWEYKYYTNFEKKKLNKKIITKTFNLPKTHLKKKKYVVKKKSYKK
jgi:repressor of nif and glnA expression